ncbi:MAG: homoserine dehydrogenase [Campylobacterales bacterium]|nr:homoserine dehydrogenase [Campylobacterales bacterium]
MIKVGIIGVGTVGSSVAKILEENEQIITARAGKKIVATKGVVKNLSKKRDLNIALSDNTDFILDDPEINIVVELMGGVDDAYNVVKKALKNNKAIVTANKALLAYHRYELQEIAGELPFEFEASVAGGIPIIEALRVGLSANHVLAIRGIMNGTCNYILTKMANEKCALETVLKEAQDLGYAEADPTFDIGGFDAAHKLLILSSIAYGIDTKPEDILIEGIENITQDDFYFAQEFGYKIKLLAIAKKVGNEIELRVHPTLIDENLMLSKVDGVMNGISIIGDRVGETMYYGAGAGGNATASAVVSDIIDIVRSGKSKPMLGFKKPMEGEGLKLASNENIVSKYYLRVSVADKAGVLAKIASIFGQNDISIEAMMQQPKTWYANLLISTHKCKECQIQNAIKEISTLEFVTAKPIMIRIEEF